MKEKWTAEQETNLRRCWCDKALSISKMAPHIGRNVSRASIAQKANQLGLPLRSAIFGGQVARSLDGKPNGTVLWTPEEDAIVRAMWGRSDADLSDIAEAVGRDISPSSVSRRASRLGLTSRKAIKKKTRASPGEGRKNKATGAAQPEQALTTGCNFPLQLVRPRKFCGVPTAGRWCEFHSTLMGLDKV